MLLIPKVVDQYNFFMGGVDIADQRRSYYHTQLRTCRNWYPLFFWLLDTAIINSFILYRLITLNSKPNESHSPTGSKPKKPLNHREFRELLYRELLSDCLKPSERGKEGRFTLPILYSEESLKIGKYSPCLHRGLYVISRNRFPIFTDSHK